MRTPLGANAVACNAHAGDILVARAVLQVFKGCISDVLVYRQADRRLYLVLPQVYVLTPSNWLKPCVSTALNSGRNRL